MTDLHTQLVAAVHARAAVARAATPGPWGWRDQTALGQFKTSLLSGRWPNEVMVVPSGWPDVYPSGANADFMEANGPDVVLRQCEADLRRLDRHAPDVLRGVEYGQERTRTVCSDCADPPESYADWPCAEVLDIAAALGVEVGDE